MGRWGLVQPRDHTDEVLWACTTSADLAATIADSNNADRIADGVHAHATHFDMLGLQLGYVYADGALAHEAGPPAPNIDPSAFEPNAAEPTASVPVHHIRLGIDDDVDNA
jgi:hypothetical protein